MLCQHASVAMQRARPHNLAMPTLSPGVYTLCFLACADCHYLCVCWYRPGLCGRLSSSHVQLSDGFQNLNFELLEMLYTGDDITSQYPGLSV